MICGMGQNRHNVKSPGDPDRQIVFLLDRIQEQSSIVDRLMDIPLALSDGASDAPEWDTAVIRRLEARLADTMREILGPEAERKSA